MKRPTLFLDRDGVINIDHGYVHTPENFKFIDGIFEVVTTANQAGYLVVIVTNQSGIGRGYYSEEQFHVLTEWMKTKFIENGGRIDAVYFCPYHPDHGIGEYRQETDFRKPAPGMLLQAQRELDIDFERSILIGDKLSDMRAGSRAGIKKLIFLNGSANGCISIRSLCEVLPFLKIESAR